MGFFLLDRPNPHGPHYYTSRRGKVKAGVVHITAGLEDLDARDDRSAEQTAAYAASTPRRVSWHSGSDTDSALDLLPSSYVAFHARGYNTHTIGHEISKAHTDWRTMPPTWVEETLQHAAGHLGPIGRRLGIPARHATRAELDHAIATDGPPVGWIAHAVLDPGRRTDPGLVDPPGPAPVVDTFPWSRFLALLAPLPPTPDPEVPPMAAGPTLVRDSKTRKVYLVTGREKPRHVQTAEMNLLRVLDVIEWKDEVDGVKKEFPFVLSPEQIAELLAPWP